MKNEKASLRSISKIVWKNIIIIVIITIVFSLIGALYAKHKKHTVYESDRSMMTVSSYHGASANEEVQADINLGKTYAKIVESDDVARAAHKQLPKKLKKKYDTQQISSMINADPIMQTTIIKVSAKAGSAKDSASVVNAVTEAASKQISKKVPSAEKMSLFAKAKAEDAQSKTSPSVKKFGMLGASIGFLIGIIVAFSITTWEKLV